MKSAAQKQSGFAPMLKNVFRRNILSLILTQILTLPIVLIYVASFLTKRPTEIEDITSGYSTALSITLAAFSFVVALIVAYVLYRELFSRRATDFLLAMPVKRGAYYNANAIFGLVNIALSYVIAFTVSVFLIKSDTIYPLKFYIFDVAVFAKLMLMSFLSAIAVFALFVVCAAISGRKWHYFVLSYFALSGAFSLVTGLSSYVDKIWGFMLDYDYSFVVSPIASITIAFNDKLNNIIPVVVSLIAQIAVMYIAGLIAFKRRKAEVAETTVAGKILPFIMLTVFLVSDAFTALVFSNKLYLCVIIALGSMVLATLIITALFYRKPFNKLTLTSLAAAVVITAIAVCCVEIAPKATGYVDYVPEASEVESVTIETENDYVNMQSLGIFSELIFGYYYDGLGEHYEPDYVFNLSTDEAKSAVYALHKKMASDEAQDRFYDIETYEYDALNTIKLEYKLKNGKTVVRTYSINASVASEEVAAVIKTDECLDQISPMNLKNDILFVTVNRYYPNTYDEDVVFEDEIYEEEADFEDYYEMYNYEFFSLDDYSMLLDCIKKDMKKTDFNYNLLTENGFDPEYYKKWSEDNIYYGEREDAVFTLTFYSFTADASEEEKAKMLKMTPKEMLDYDEKRFEDSDYTADYLLENCAYSFAKSDDNTLKYVESNGYKF